LSASNEKGTFPDQGTQLRNCRNCRGSPARPDPSRRSQIPLTPALTNGYCHLVSFGAAIALVQKFATRTGPAAFTGLGVSRAAFAMDLMEHINSPSLIHQRNASLCGPACFLYALLQKTPETYAQFVIDLYEKGQAKVGGLEVKPKVDCKNFSVPAGGSSGPSNRRTGISAVDWVSLAGLRDSSNIYFDYDFPSVGFGGITMPSGMAGWFKNSWKFQDVVNRTNVYLTKDLLTLVQAHQKFCAGHKVCLFIGGNVLTGEDGGKLIPDHWVLLSSQISIDGSLATNLTKLGAKVNDSDTLQQASVEFTVCTWGNPNMDIGENQTNLTVSGFLDYFYGFVSAK